MGMWLANRIVRAMRVPMMLIVTMRMIVRDPLMDMLVFMHLRNMEPHTPIPIRSPPRRAPV